MKPPEGPVTIEEFNKQKKDFCNDCEKSGAIFVHKNCGGGIRVGFMNLFAIDENGKIDPGSDGFGIGPVEVPYCEKCGVPDGFNHTWARRIFIKKPPEKVSEKGKELVFHDQ